MDQMGVVGLQCNGCAGVYMARKKNKGKKANKKVCKRKIKTKKQIGGRESPGTRENTNFLCLRGFVIK